MIQTREISLTELHEIENCELLSKEENAYTTLFKTKHGTVIKLYYGCLSDHESAARDQDTLYTLAQSNFHFPKHFIMPIYIYTIDKKIVGYEMPFCQGCVLSEALKTASISDAVRWFSQIYKDILWLTSLHPSVSFGDLHEDNIFVDTNGKLFHCDVDGWRISSHYGKRSRYLSLSHGLYENQLKKYSQEKDGIYFLTDRNSDIYCLNVMVMNYLMRSNLWFVNLQGMDIFLYLDYLEKTGLPKGIAQMMHTLFEHSDNIFDIQAMEALPDDISCFSYESYLAATNHFSDNDQALEYLNTFSFEWNK